MKSTVIRIVLFGLSFFSISCNGKKIEDSSVHKIETIDSLEYAVLNQTLSLLGENILFNGYNYGVPIDFQKEFFEERFKNVDKKIIFERIKIENIDTTKTSIYSVDFLLFWDSLSAFNQKKSFKIDLKKINHPEQIILIGENDTLLSLDFRLIKIRLSRVSFNQAKTKAEYRFEINRGPLNAAGYLIKCELKNGAWVVVNEEMMWVS